MRFGIIALTCLTALPWLTLFSATNISAETTIIHAGRLIDGNADQVRENVSIVIEDGKIAKVVDGWIEAKEGDTIHNLRSHTVMPGLMDMHTHLTSQMSKESYTEKFFMTEAEVALRSSQFAERTLLAGFTTVRDLGDNGVNTVSLRKAIDNGWIVGPRIYTATKSLATTGGHADPTNGLRGAYRRTADPSEGVLNSPEEAQWDKDNGAVYKAYMMQEMEG